MKYCVFWLPDATGGFTSMLCVGPFGPHKVWLPITGLN